MGLRATALTVGLALVAAGCGASSGSYAGMNRDQALDEAVSAAGTAIRSGSSPIRGHSIRVRTLVRGHSSDGGDAWVAHFADRTVGGEFCVRVRAGTALNIRSYSVEFDGCEGEPAEPGPGGDGPGSA